MSPELSPPPPVATSTELSSSAVKTGSNGIAQSEANLCEYYHIHTKKTDLFIYRAYSLVSPELSPPPAMATSSESSSPAIKTTSDDVAQSQATICEFYH